MQQDPKNLNKESHDQSPQDAATKNKIDKHLSDINDTISEDDIKKINTSTGTSPATQTDKHFSEENEIDDNADENDRDKESPTAWEISGG